MTGEELYAREALEDRSWDDLLPSVQEGWNTLAEQITLWGEALDAYAAAE